jgi:hypothetical protein
MTKRDKEAAWCSLGSVCRERDWSRPRAIYELQNGLLFRTVPPGYEPMIDWHDPWMRQLLDLETSELPPFLFERAVRIEVQPPADTEPPLPSADALPSAEWALAVTRKLQGDELKGVTRKSELARLLAAKSEKAAKDGEIRRQLKASYLENVLIGWGCWPLSSLE